MHFLTHNIVSNKLWDKKRHHKLCNQARTVYMKVETDVDTFHAKTGKHPSRDDIDQVDSVVASLRKAQHDLRRMLSQAEDDSTRPTICEHDYQYMIKREGRTGDWLEKVEEIQRKLQKQIEAEQWFHRQEEPFETDEQAQECRQKRQQRDSISTATTIAAADEFEKELSSFDEQQLDEYLNQKPLPPLRQTVYKSGKRYRVTVLPPPPPTAAPATQIELSLVPTLNEKDIQVDTITTTTSSSTSSSTTTTTTYDDYYDDWEDHDDLDPIIEAYKRMHYNLESDGFIRLPRLSKQWI